MILVRLGSYFDISLFKQFNEVVDPHLKGNFMRIFIDFRAASHFDAASVPMLLRLRYKFGVDRQITLINFNWEMVNDADKRGFSQLFNIMDSHGQKLEFTRWGELALLNAGDYFNDTVKADILGICSDQSYRSIKHYFIDFAKTRWTDDSTVNILLQFRSRLLSDVTVTLIDFNMELVAESATEGFRNKFRIIKRSESFNEELSETVLRRIINSTTTGKESNININAARSA